MSNLVPESEQQYGSILTVLGENAEQNGKLLNKQIEFTHIAFGDANDTYVQPDRKSQALVHELHRIPVNSVDVLQPTPDSVPILKVEAILPDNINDVVIREFAAVATFNGQTYFHAIGNCARIYVPKPLNNGNVSNPVILEMTFVITSAEPIIEVDPTVVTASREYVNHNVNKSQEELGNISIWPADRRFNTKVDDVITYPATALRINSRLFALDKEIPSGSKVTTINLEGGTVTAGGKQYLLGGGLDYGTVTAEGGTAFRKLSEMAADRVNVKSFGAIESTDDLFVDATESFQKAFDFARKKGRIVEAKGRYFISKHLRAYTAFDFSEATIVLPSDFDYGGGALEGAAIFIEEPDEQTIENFDLSGLYKGSAYHSSLAQFGVCTIFYESYTENAYKRNNGGDISYLKKQDILNCSSGYFQSTPSLYTINDPVKLTVKPIRERFTVYAPKWEIQGVPEVWAIPSLLSVKRNNVTVIGGYVNTFDVAAGIGRQPVNAFVRIIKSCFCNVTDMHTIGYNADFSYCVHLIGTYKTTIERCSDQKNWALVDGVTMRNTTCRDTVGSRIGSHYDAVDFYVYNHESTRSGIIVCGHGVLKIAGYRHTQLTSGGQNAISTRGDYAACWDGEVDISGVHIVFEGQVGSGAGLLKLSASKDGTESLEHEVRLPHTINIKDVTLEDKSPTGHNSSYQLLQYNIDWNQPTWLPTEINLRRIYETGYRNLRLGYSASLGVISHDNCVPITTTYNMYGLENVTGNHDIFQQFESSVAAKNKVIRNFFNHKGLRVVCNWPAGYELNIVDSDVSHIDGLFANNSNEAVCTIKNSRIHGQFMRWYSTGNGEMHLFNNTFKDPNELKISNAITICSSNVIPDGCVITGGAFTVEDFWQYKAPQYGKGFKTIRQGVAPNLNVMPLYLGEEYLQTVGGKAMWKALSSTNNDEWILLGSL
ncbi:phage tail protein [Vibrio parahaemolyticus]|nr:phage tail protein [Vibrio parahaemolyticus]